MALYKLILAGVFSLNGAMAAEIKQPLVSRDMNATELTERKRQLLGVEKKACKPGGIGRKVWNGSRYVTSAVVDTLPIVPLAWTGLQTAMGRNERVEDKKYAAGGKGALYTTQTLGGGVMTVVTAAVILLEILIAYEQTHDQVYTSGYSYNYSSGQYEHFSGFVYVPNGKSYQPTGAVGGIFGWLASSYSNTRTVSQAIRREKAIKDEVCRQTRRNLNLIDDLLPRDTNEVVRPSGEPGLR